jgi:hypothetical protein
MRRILGMSCRVAFYAIVVCVLCAAAKSSDEPDSPPELTVQPSIEKTLGYTPKLQPPAATAKTLKEILARPEFAATKKQSKKISLLDRIKEFIERLFSHIGLAPGKWAGTIAVIIALALLIFLILRIVTGYERRSSGLSDGGGTLAKPKTAGELLAEADQAAARGDFRDAVRLRFRAMLRQLELPASTVQTNTQLLRRIGQDYPAAHGALTDLVQCFEDAWYGSLPCDRGDYDRSSRLAGEVVDTVRSVQE